MQDNFTYTLVSDDGNGGNFYNSFNEMLDFQTTPYEVCLREIFISYGAWDNVRPGSNWIEMRHVSWLPWKYVYMKPGKYDSLDKYITSLNEAVHIKAFTLEIRVKEDVDETATTTTDDEKKKADFTIHNVPYLLKPAIEMINAALNKKLLMLPLTAN